MILKKIKKTDRKSNVKCRKEVDTSDNSMFKDYIMQILDR